MRTADIKVGEEYAWRRNNYGKRHRVKVLQTGLPEHQGYKPQKSHVEIEFLDELGNGWGSIEKGTRKIVASREIRMTWAEAREEAERQAKADAKRKAEAEAARALAKEWEETLTEAGFDTFRNGVSDDFVRVQPARIGAPTITFKGTEAEKLVKTLEALETA